MAGYQCCPVIRRPVNGILLYNKIGHPPSPKDRAWPRIGVAQVRKRPWLLSSLTVKIWLKEMKGKNWIAYDGFQVVFGHQLQGRLVAGLQQVFFLTNGTHCVYDIWKAKVRFMVTTNLLHRAAVLKLGVATFCGVAKSQKGSLNFAKSSKMLFLWDFLSLKALPFYNTSTNRFASY